MLVLHIAQEQDGEGAGRLGEGRNSGPVGANQPVPGKRAAGGLSLVEYGCGGWGEDVKGLFIPPPPPPPPPPLALPPTGPADTPEPYTEDNPVH